mmetsp:Transcript_58133/g.101778  ORF Transcript_58133/g.101778 Transcript_58133/m.101778 type:complete len:532 (-) Transcript_58133:4-1599(-)
MIQVDSMISTDSEEHHGKSAHAPQTSLPTLLTNAERTCSLVPRLAKKQGHVSTKGLQLPCTAAASINQCIGQNYAGGNDLRLLAMQARVGLWRNFVDDILVVIAKQGRFSLMSEIHILGPYFHDFTEGEFTDLARFNGLAATFVDHPNLGTRLQGKSVKLMWGDASELRSLALSYWKVEWTKFYEAVLLPAAEKGELGVSLEINTLASHFERFDSTDFIQCACSNGVKGTYCTVAVAATNSEETTSKAVLSWSDSSELMSIALSSWKASWAKFHEAVVLPAAQRGELWLKLDDSTLEMYFGSRPLGDFREIALLNGCELEPCLKCTWSDSSELRSIALEARQTMWSKFYEAVLLPAARQGKLGMKLEVLTLQSYFGSATDFEELAGLNGCKLEKDLDRFGCRRLLVEDLLTWSDNNHLRSIALKNRHTLWTNFYDDVLLPAAQRGKLRVKLHSSVLRSYFTAFEVAEFTELAQMNGVVVTGGEGEVPITECKMIHEMQLVELAWSEAAVLWRSENVLLPAWRYGPPECFVS